MKKLIVALTLSIAFTPPHSKAQPPAFPPDFYNDFERDGYALYENPNPGWVVNTSGQLQTDVQYVTEGALPRTYIRKEAEMSFVLSKVDTSTTTLDTLRRLDMKLVGPYAQYPDAVALEQKPHHLNFYLPHCGLNGVTDVHGYSRIVYENIYPYIDLWVYSGKRGQKMMFVIRPFGDPAHIQMLFSGQDELDVDVNGWLRLQIGERWIVLPEAVAYQVDENQEIIPVNWTSQYVPNPQEEDIVGFNFDEFDRYKPLVLLIGPPPAFGGGNYDEPGLCWSTYSGGGNDDYNVQTDEDNAGNYYVTGVTSSTIESFPDAPGVTNYNGGVVSFVLKFDVLDQLLWKTFYGGSPGEYCNSRGCTVTESSVSSGVYIAGNTSTSQLIMVVNNGAHVFDPTYLETMKRAFIAKFRLANGSLSWASYVEGERVFGIASSDNGRVFITGRSGGYAVDEDDLDDQPPSPNSAYWSEPTAPWSLTSGFIAMYNIQDRLNWFTYFTNNSEPDGFGGWIPFGWNTSEIAVQGDRVVVQGSTNCATLPNAGCPTGSYCEPLANYNESDAVIYEFNLDGVPVWSTYFGETGWIDGYSLDESFYPGTTVAIDAVTGDIVIAGTVINFGTVPIVPGPGWYSNVPALNGRTSFVARFSGQTRDLIWSSYIPVDNASYAAIHSVAFDAEGSLYIGGATRSTALPLTQYGGIYHQPTINANEGVVEDAFLICIAPDYQLRFATYIGGEASAGSYEAIYHIAQRSTSGNMYVVGGTSKAQLVDSYFPLDDGGGLPSFWPEWAGGLQDGFISSFCPEALTFLPQLPLSGGQPILRYEDPSHISLSGLSDGVHQFALLDAGGRLLLSNQVSSFTGRSGLIDTGSMSSGVYLVRCEGRIFRFCKP